MDDDENPDPTSGKPTITVWVHIKDKSIAVPVHKGGQSLKWLATVAMARYDNFSSSLEPYTGMYRTNGDQLEPLSRPIFDELAHDEHVVLKFPAGPDGGADAPGAGSLLGKFL